MSDDNDNDENGSTERPWHSKGDKDDKTEKRSFLRELAIIIGIVLGVAAGAVRLTDEEVDICFDGSDGTRIGAARAIETAVLRKNGIEVAE